MGRRRKLSKIQEELRETLKEVLELHPSLIWAFEHSKETMILDGEGFSISIKSPDGTEDLAGLHDRPKGYNPV